MSAKITAGIAYTEVLGRVASACAGRAAPAARLVAVSKTKPNELITDCYEVGCRHFGENYVQELCEKAPVLPSDIKWHMIGPVQSNKCKMLAKIPNLFMIETVATPKLATQLNKAWASRSPTGGSNSGDEEEAAAAAGGASDSAAVDSAENFQAILNVLVQINTSGEESKSGCQSSEEVKALVKHILDSCENLKFCGLMTIGKLGEEAPECFEALVKYREDVCAEFGMAQDDLELSMGMSNDYAQAIEFGSTNVRVGSTIFGARDYSQQ